MTSYHVRLLGRFHVQTDGVTVALRRPVARLVALLALEDAQCVRTIAASTLWPDVREERALANLRSIYWRAGLEAPGLVNGDSHALWLSPRAVVDYRGGNGDSFDELLPDWADEWLVLPRFLEHQISTVTARPR